MHQIGVLAQEAIVELWPTQYLEPDTEPTKRFSSHGETALIILNSPISDLQSFLSLYNHAAFCICADGGANRLHDLMIKSDLSSEWSTTLALALPDIVHGDLDSLDETVRKRYEHLGVKISKDPDQYSTDFAKGVRKIKERLPGVRHILILGSIGGRVDQGIGLLHELYREQTTIHPGVRFWLFTEASITILLGAGTSVIHTPVADGRITHNIGILPLYGPAKISTKGLEWDVTDWATELGGQVSTSNHIVHTRTVITTNKDILFTLERAIVD